MLKRLSVFVLILLFFACASPPKPEPPAPPAPPPLPPKAGVDTEFVLLGYHPEAELKDLTEDLLAKKEAVYSAVKSLSSSHNVVIIYDASGSMTSRIPGMTLKRYEAAYEGLRRIGHLFSSHDHVWLIVFGSKKPFGIQGSGLYRKDYVRAVEAGSDVEVVFSPKDRGFDEKAFLVSIKHLESEKAYIGDTPIGYSVLKARELLAGRPNAKVILISDGEETGSILADNISKSKAWEQRLRARYPHLDDITLSAEEAVGRLVSQGISFNPILYGVTNPQAGGAERGAQSIRAFYQKMASASQSVYLEAATPLELLNAFMDAEMMSVAYALYPPRGEAPVATGKVGIPVTVKEGRYLLRTKTEQAFESGVEARPAERNVYGFDIDEAGKLKIVRIQE